MSRSRQLQVDIDAIAAIPQGQEVRPFKRFLGVDLGGGKGKKTAVALLEATADGVSVMDVAPRAGRAPLYDTALIDLIRACGDEAKGEVHGHTGSDHIGDARGAGVPRCPTVHLSIRRIARAVKNCSLHAHLGHGYFTSSKTRLAIGSAVFAVGHPE